MRSALLSHLVLVVTLCACPATTAPPEAHGSTKARPKSRGEIPPPFVLEHGVVVVDSPAGPQRFKVEIAAKPNEQQRGLMYREALAEDEGMIFLFAHQKVQSFWMKNTWIPLDMLFIDEDLVVRGIVENAEPLTTTSRKIDAPTRYVLEVKGGLTRKLGIVAGAKVTFEGIPELLWQKTPTKQETP